MRLEVPDRDMMSFPLPIALFIYSPSLLGRQLKSNVIGRQQPKWRKTQRRFTVSSEHSCVYVKCIPRPPLLRRKYTSTHRPRGWGTPFASRISSLPPFFLPRMTMCDALSFPSFFFFFFCISTGQSILSTTTPQRIHLGPDCENVKVQRSAKVKILCEVGRPVFFVFRGIWFDFGRGWMPGGKLMCGFCQV